jgi:general secretion pathway protein G
MLLTSTRRKVAHRSAFTLMEVLVVVAILVILAGVAVVAVPKYIEDARKSKAMLACKSLEQACEAYHISPQNPDGSWPQAGDLLHPFGGSATSFLKNGDQDLKDPWGNPYQIEVRTKGDGVTQYVLVHTQAKDGTQISQYGIGQQATPPNN